MTAYTQYLDRLKIPQKDGGYYIKDGLFNHTIVDARRYGRVHLSKNLDRLNKVVVYAIRTDGWQKEIGVISYNPFKKKGYQYEWTVKNEHNPPYFVDIYLLNKDGTLGKKY